MRGSPSALPVGWIPIKTAHGWTATQVRYDEEGIPAGFTTLKDDTGQMRFWSRRYRMTQEIATWAVFAELEELRAKVRRYEQHQAPVLGSIA